MLHFAHLCCAAANFSGTGNERNQNGTSGLTTAWAQPSGLTLAEDALFVADSESSSVRRLDLRSGGSQAIVGGDPLFSDNLFKWVWECCPASIMSSC